MKGVGKAGKCGESKVGQRPGWQALQVLCSEDVYSWQDGGEGVRY